jgi:hypothetical protein
MKDGDAGLFFVAKEYGFIAVKIEMGLKNCNG